MTTPNVTITVELRDGMVYVASTTADVPLTHYVLELAQDSLKQCGHVDQVREATPQEAVAIALSGKNGD